MDNPTIAVYGATGFTGRLVIAELARRGTGVVLVGRDPARLRDVAPHGDIRPAGLDDPAALAAALRGCHAVINCVAPFVALGEPVVRAAIAAGCHYVDISGELAHVRRTFDTFQAAAERAGVTVVPMVNDGGFLVDLVTGVAAGRVGRVRSIVVAHRFTGTPALSRGSARSLLANADTFRLDPAGAASLFVFPGDAAPTPVVSVGLPELATIPRHVPTETLDAVLETATVTALAAVLAAPELVESLPAGPAAAARRAGRFVLVADVRGAAGRTVGVVEGMDTYGSTAVIAAAAAVRLAAGAAKAGVLAPAQAFEPVEFLDSLAPQGIRWTATGDQCLV